MFKVILQIISNKEKNINGSVPKAKIVLDYLTMFLWPTCVSAIEQKTTDFAFKKIFPAVDEFKT